MSEQQPSEVLCAACYLTLTQAGFNPCDQSSPGCPPVSTAPAVEESDD